MLHRLLIIAATAALLSGCITDKCNTVNCQNEGVCVQGTCACTYGYEGDFCERKWLDKFNRNWTAAETVKDVAVRNYSLNIVPGASPDTFYILGMAQAVDTVVCTRKSYKVFTMHERLLPDSTKMQGGEGEYNTEAGIVTGLYSFNKQDVITTVRFTWSN
jgi:hypothetical protein